MTEGEREGDRERGRKERGRGREGRERWGNRQGGKREKGREYVPVREGGLVEVREKKGGKEEGWERGTGKL